MRQNVLTKTQATETISNSDANIDPSHRQVSVADHVMQSFSASLAAVMCEA
jgi:hypothetical protein